ncbi:MAG: hypothetical protein AAF845_20080, partial [Bacteroidota bacterium]
YWPGPLAADGGPPSAEACAAADRIWRVTLADVAAYNASGVATADLLEWPVHLGAPVVDGDGDPGNYSLAGGDRPAILGDETAWWVMNDQGGFHRESWKPPVGLEVRVTAFSVSEAYGRVRLGMGATEAEHVHHATFYRYAFTRRGGEPLVDAHVGFFVDGDIGNHYDDAVGSHPRRDLAYFYNVSNVDSLYGASPPAAGLRVLREGGGPGLSAMVPSSPRLGPAFDHDSRDFGIERYRNLLGLWSDGVPLTVGRYGYNPGSDDFTRYGFSGVPPAYWSELNLGSSFSFPGDRRAIASSGPFSLPPDTTVTVDVAYLWARSDRGHLASVYRLVQEAAPASVLVPFTPDPALATILPADLPRLPEVVPPPPVIPARAGLAASAWPSPASGRTVVRYDLATEAEVRLDVVDALGRVVAVLAEGTLGPGERRAEVDVRGWAPGLYMYRLRLGGRMAGTGRLIVAR